MHCLDKVSLSHSRDEDRICLRSEIVKGQILWLWLTNRLACQLLPHLLYATRGSPQTQGPPDGHGRCDERFPDDEKVPVPTSAELHQNILIRAIQIRSNSEHIELTFKGDGSVAASRITLSLNDARKLLDGVRACFEEAAWPCDALREDPAEAALGTHVSVTLH